MNKVNIKDKFNKSILKDLDLSLAKIAHLDQQDVSFVSKFDVTFNLDEKPSEIPKKSLDISCDLFVTPEAQNLELLERIKTLEQHNKDLETHLKDYENQANEAGLKCLEIDKEYVKLDQSNDELVDSYNELV